MRKKRILILLLSLVMLLQLLVPAGYATETEENATEETVEEETAPLTSFAVEEVLPDDAAVVNGCRTMDGMYPLGGSDRMLDSAQSAFVYERNTQTVIYSYNPDLRLYPGALSKMLTAMIALEYCEMDDPVTVKSFEFEFLPLGALNAKIREGEKMTMGDLLHLMILESANDAALAVATHVAGSQTQFVELMNRKLQDLGCTNTHLVDCHGLSTTDQYTTARDMARIVEYCTSDPDFCSVFNATSYTVPATNKSEERAIKSVNYLTEQTIVPKFNYKGVVGGMPSYSGSTGASIVCTAEKNSMDLIFVVMGATRQINEKTGVASYYGNFEEVISLLEYTFNGFRIYRMMYEGQALKQFQVANGEQDVVLCPGVSIDSVLPIGTKQTNLIEKYNLQSGGITAPLSRGQQVATVQMWYGSSCLADVELYAMCDIRSLDNTGLTIVDASRDDTNLGEFLAFVGILCLVLVLLLGGYLAYNSFRRSMVRARRRRRRASRRRSR